MQCPKCKSDDAIKLSLVHAAGLSEIQTSSRGHTLALGDAGLLLGSGHSTATGASQTLLSKVAAPPRKKPYWHVILAWLIGLAIGGSLILDLNVYTVNPDAHVRHQFHVFAYIFSFLVAFVLAVLWRYNRRILPRQRELWNRSFMCRRCGEIFQLSGEHSRS